MTQTYTSAERAKAQAAYDFLIWPTVAVTSLWSGQLLHHRGWAAVLSTAVPVLGLAMAVLPARGARARRRGRSEPDRPGGDRGRWPPRQDHPGRGARAYPGNPWWTSRPAASGRKAGQ